MTEKYKISVAMITYNGVNYIEEQLTSILNQTVKPDEVIISDDGSTDGSVELIKGIIGNYIDNGIRIVLLTDNPTHGISQNFSWAFKHTTGDIVFSSGQDDIWREDKIEKVLNVYYQHPDAQVVVTDLEMIDKNGDPYTGNTVQIYIEKTGLKDGELIKTDRAKYLSLSETVTLIAGPVLSFKRSIYDLVIPLPVNVYEDQWIEFIGVAEDSMYYLNEKTTYYRVHDSVSNSANISLSRRIQRTLSRIRIAYKTPLTPLCFENAILKYFADYNEDEFVGRQDAIDTAHMVLAYVNTEFRYMRMNRIKGAFCYIKMFIKDVRYRKSGVQSFLICLFYTLFYSKKRRNREIDAELEKCHTS